MTYKYEKRFYPYFSPRDGRYKVQIVTYTLWFDGEELVDIRNEVHNSVERGSECWEFFANQAKVCF